MTSIHGKSQNIDSILSVPQTLELKISTPQPRIGEKFSISLDINYVRAHIFKTAFGKIQVVDDPAATDPGLMKMDVKAVEKGRVELGPLQFTLNGTKYTTNKLVYNVIDALPKIDNGVWIRKVATSDSTFCIIVEQRIPANRKVERVSATETKIWTEPEHDKLAKMKFDHGVKGLRNGSSSSYSETSSFETSEGEPKRFLSGYSLHYFEIVDKNKRIIITKDSFENLPAGYKFQDIIIQ